MDRQKTGNRSLSHEQTVEKREAQKLHHYHEPLRWLAFINHKTQKQHQKSESAARSYLGIDKKRDLGESPQLTPEAGTRKPGRELYDDLELLARGEIQKNRAVAHWAG